MTTEYNALIAEARGWADWNRKISLGHNQNQRRLLNDLADALESAFVERALVEAQALEQAADNLIERGFPAAVVPHILRARAVEIREGRQ